MMDRKSAKVIRDARRSMDSHRDRNFDSASNHRVIAANAELEQLCRDLETRWMTASWDATSVAPLKKDLDAIFARGFKVVGNVQRRDLRMCDRGAKHTFHRLLRRLHEIRNKVDAAIPTSPHVLSKMISQAKKFHEIKVDMKTQIHLSGGQTVRDFPHYTPQFDPSAVLVVLAIIYLELERRWSRGRRSDEDDDSGHTG